MNLYESVNKNLKESVKLNETGEWDDYDEDNIASKNHLTEIAKYISEKVPNGDYDEARGFDAYRGPYAYVSSDITGGELWYGETDEEFQLDTGYGWIVGDKDTLVKALSDEAYLSQLVEETKKYIDSLNEAAGDRYIIKKYEGVGAPYGIWDTQAKKFVHKGEKEAFDKDGNRIESPLEKECKRRNEKDKEKKLKESESGDIWEKIDNLMYKLLHNNKNYNKEQYYGLLELEELLDQVRPKEGVKESSLCSNLSQSLKEAGNGSYIIKTVDWESDPIKADSKEEAMDIFANEFDNDLNTYFKAVSQNLNEREEERSWSDDGKFLNMREMVARALENNIHDKEFTDEEIDQIFGEVVDNDQYMEEIYMEIENQALEAAKKYRGE